MDADKDSVSHRYTCRIYHNRLQYIIEQARQQNVRFFESIDLDFKRGDRVRITEGVLKGAEGYIARVHGTTRFIVVIEGVAAVATTCIPKHFIEKIKKNHLTEGPESVA